MACTKEGGDANVPRGVPKNWRCFFEVILKGCEFGKERGTFCTNRGRRLNLKFAMLVNYGGKEKCGGSSHTGGEVREEA